MKYKLVRDRLVRQNFKNKENLLIAAKSCRLNMYLDQEIIDFSKKILSKEKGLETKIKNRCIVTGRSHAIMRKFKVSRIQFKEMAAQGLILGIKKASW